MNACCSKSVPYEVNPTTQDPSGVTAWMSVLVAGLEARASLRCQTLQNVPATRYKIDEMSTVWLTRMDG